MASFREEAETIQVRCRAIHKGAHREKCGSVLLIEKGPISGTFCSLESVF